MRHVTPKRHSPNLALLELRKRLNLTQEQAARKIGKDRESWNKWETGARGVSPESAQLIAAQYGGTPADYITRSRDFSAVMLGQLVLVLEAHPEAVQQLRPLLEELVEALYDFAQRLEAALKDDRASQTPPST